MQPQREKDKDNNDFCRFDTWHAARLAADGRVDESLPLFKKAFDMWPLWRELVQRLPASGLLPDDPELMAAILAVE